MLGPEKSNLAKTQDKDFKIAMMKMFKDIKKDINKWLIKIMRKQAVKWNNENNSMQK